MLPPSSDCLQVRAFQSEPVQRNPSYFQLLTRDTCPVLPTLSAERFLYFHSVQRPSQNRRRSTASVNLEEDLNNIVDLRYERIRDFQDMAREYFNSYKIRLPDSATFAEYAIGHLDRLLGGRMLVDFNETVITKYQNDRLEEGAAPKTINEEVGFLLRILGEPGDIPRTRLRKRKMLKLKVRMVIGKAYAEEEKRRMPGEAAKARSPHIYLALTLALNAGMRDAEIKSLSWAQINFAKRFLAVGRAKTKGGAGRTIPLNSDLFEVLITKLAESGAGDQTIMDSAGHVSKQMLKHYSHIRMEAKRNALEACAREESHEDARAITRLSIPGSISEYAPRECSHKALPRAFGVSVLTTSLISPAPPTERAASQMLSGTTCLPTSSASP